MQLRNDNRYIAAVPMGMKTVGSLTNEDWVQLLRGECPLVRKILPYLDSLHRRSGGRGRKLAATFCSLVGMYDHDYYMCVHAVLVLMMAWSMNTNDTRWLENPELVVVLKGFDSAEMVPYASGKMGSAGWLEQCIVAMSVIDRVSAESVEPQNTSGFMGSLFVPVSGRTHGRTADMARLVDGCNVQMLRDVFYIVTGMTTGGDTESGRASKEKSCCTDGMPLESSEELVWCRWCPWCPMMDSSECEMEVCSHFTGVLPVVMRGLG